jgi:rhomboid protease GluP
METPERPLLITPDMLLGRRVDFERRMHRRPPITLAIIGVLSVVFVIESARGVLDSAQGLVAFGALSRPEVFAGQYWRLESATWLHGTLNHLVSNAIALFILGMIVEHAFGRAQYFTLYVLSGLGGSFLSLLMSEGPSVGASGAIFGLQGAAIVLFRQHRDRLLLRDRRVGFVLLIWALYTIVTGLLTPFVDNGAHIGGALGGALVARRLHPVALSPLSPAQAARVRRWLWVIGALGLYTLVGWTGR